MISSGYKMMEKLIARAGTKKFLALPEDQLREEVRIEQAKVSEAPPRKLFKQLHLVKETYEEQEVYKISPKEDKADQVILFIHGGAYIKKMSSLYWDFLCRLVKQTKACCYVPLYPVAPEHSYEETFLLLDSLYDEIEKKEKDKKIILMGDSAGGQIALSFTEKVQLERKKKIDRLILISPVINPVPDKETIRKMKEVEVKDCMLSYHFFETAVRWWRRGTEETDYLVNPLFCSYNGFPKTIIFSGTHDILNVQVEDLLNAFENKDVEYTYIERKEMMHIWPLLPRIVECEKAFAEIVQFIKEK